MILAPPEPDTTPDEPTVPDQPPLACYASLGVPNFCPSDGIAVWEVQNLSEDWFPLCTPCKERWSAWKHVLQAVRL